MRVIREVLHVKDSCRLIVDSGYFLSVLLPSALISFGSLPRLGPWYHVFNTENQIHCGNEDNAQIVILRYKIKDTSLNIILVFSILAQEEFQLEALSRADSTPMPHSILSPITSTVQRGKIFDRSEPFTI